ncbi:hypothetical protein GO755_40655, partial [Spirosoma sp. HMF4905]
MNTLSENLFNVNLEAGLLGAILIESSLMRSALTKIKQENIFFHHAHREIYRAMLDLQAEGIQPEIVDVTHRLRRNGSRLTAVDILELTREASLPNFEARCLQVYELFHRREAQA